jgi:hypothetical protein
LSAFEGWQYQLRSFILSSPSFSVTSVGVMAVRSEGTFIISAIPTHMRRFEPKWTPGKRTIRQVLLVGKHQQQAVLHLAVVQDLVQLGPRLVDAVAVLRVDDKDEALRARVVVSPERPDLVLSADVLREGGVSGAGDRTTCERERRTHTLNLRLEPTVAESAACSSSEACSAISSQTP